MMIRINLLPVRQVQKREQGRQFLVLLIGTLIIVGAANAYWYVWMDGKRETAQRRLDDTNARIQQLEKVIGEVNNLAKRKKEVEEKLAELDKLLTERKGPVKLLDALATSIPKKVWLNNFEEKAGSTIMSGNAESYDDVSEFMRSLKNIIWSPKGMGRVVERKRDGHWRVELIQSGEGSIEEFTEAEVKEKGFFNNIELKSTTVDAATKRVKFDMALSTNMKQ
ncbi:MAG: PilN domain-containing protein [Archangium sp.]|nr:PilN domain-containing protein [Archangium sp.]